MDHVREAPMHPQTQGKIERWHQTLKNRILLENYYLPGDLEQKIGDFISHYNHLRYHESIANLGERNLKNIDRPVGCMASSSARIQLSWRR
jgi:transposase InsO family protein